MSFLNPVWLVALGGVILYMAAARRKGWRFDTSQILLLLAAVFMIIALSRPVVSQKPLEVQQGGSDVIIAVDLSYSMRSSDIVPSRLDAAKKLLKDLVRSNPRDRFGVIGFTTSAIILSPLTRDTELLEHLFESLDESQIITKGTDVMSALELARKMSHAERPTLILLTDGGDEPGYGKEADFVRENALFVNIVMLASTQGSTLLNPDGSILKDEAGHIVVSSRNDAIEEISRAGGGKMIQGADLDAVKRVVESVEKEDFQGSSTVPRNQELFYIPLVMALIAFVVSMTNIAQKISRRLIPLLALLGISANAGVLDFAYLYLAERNYDQGEFERAAQLYGKIDSPQARYNRANALYKAGKYQEAVGIYRSIRSDDAGFKSILFYNMGNCHIRLQEFENGREALLKSLTLSYTKEADENLRAIAGISEKQTLNVRKEKNDRFSREESAPTGESKPAKQGGGSNMQSDVASGGGGDEGKRAQSDPRLSMAQGKAKLSSRQYELINQRSVRETKPW